MKLSFILVNQVTSDIRRKKNVNNHLDDFKDCLRRRLYSLIIKRILFFNFKRFTEGQESVKEMEMLFVKHEIVEGLDPTMARFMMEDKPKYSRCCGDGSF